MSQGQFGLVQMATERTSIVSNQPVSEMIFSVPEQQLQEWRIRT